MKTNLFLLLACAIFVCSCEHSHSKKANETESTTTEIAASTNNEQTLNLGKTFEISESNLPNIAISGTILAYKDNVASGELVLTEKNTQKVIQKLPFVLNNGSGGVEECVGVDDFDFDGNMDILVPNGFVNDGTDDDIVYLYNSARKQFLKNESLSDAVSSSDSYELLPNKKTLITHRNGSSLDDYFDIFKIKNNVACQVQWIVEVPQYNEGEEEGEPTLLVVSVQKTECDGEVVGAPKNYKFRPYPNNYKGEGYYKKYIE